ncbi:MAG: diaminopimelate decarboxylase [Thermoguttaceae bacterium]|nr:diaminopimelate decarboxylase [Thermoguttaceae bacterium]MDW8080115.1 diaminopimelate decarboxylase [Thermoguttaceae bacterium]
MVEVPSLLRETIAGIPVSQLAERFGTPLYVYDGNVICQRLAELRQFDVVRYAQKACSNLAVLAMLRQEGALVDAVSAGEICRALAAGFSPEGDPPPIVYCADIFDRAALKLVVEKGIHANCGSMDMIEQLGRVAPGREITLRINPGFGHGHSRKTNTGGDHSKHGIWHEQLAEALSLADKVGLRVSGLHMHIGSGSDFEHLSQVCSAMENAARQAGDRIRSISGGGGLPIPYRPGESRIDLRRYFELWDTTRRRLENLFGHPVRLEIEPGRYLVAESGFLVTEIRSVKRQGNNLFYLVDAGFNCLARPILYGAYHPMSIAAQMPGTNNLQEVIVGGPLCESGDIFTQSEGGFVEKRRLPAAQVGDWLVIECAGAYGFTMASNYNSHPLPAEVLILDGQAHLVRRRQTFEELFASESIPERLRRGA